MCNSMPLLHLTEKVTLLTDILMMCLCPMNFSIHKDAPLGCVYEFDLMAAFPSFYAFIF